jgi:hypothetical protein
MKTRNPKRLCSLPLVVAATSLGLALSGCSDSSSNAPRGPSANDIRINQLQYLGTHNSYHVRIRQDLFDLLLSFIPDIAPTLDYSHLPLRQQFEEQGIRQIELDVFDDPEGGLYANRQALVLVGEDPASGIPELDAPGLKVLHVQEIDYESTCFTSWCWWRPRMRPSPTRSTWVLSSRRNSARQRWTALTRRS